MGQGGGSKGTRDKKPPKSSGVGIGVGGPGEGVPLQDLSFRLVNVDSGVLATVSEGDGVGLQAAGGGYHVVATAGRLGDVPPRFVQRVADSGATTATVTKKAGGSVWIRVL